MADRRRTLRGLAIGAAATLPAALLALASAGAGHGDYVLARLLFPYSMLLTRVAGGSITTPLIWLGCVQLPLYGAALGFAMPRNRIAVAAGLLVLHGAAAAACFAGVLPEFS